VAALAAAAALAAPAAASAHALITPAASRPAESVLYTLRVPNERDVATVEVALKIPEGIDFVVVENTPGWEAQVVRANDRIDVVRWTGGAIEPDFFQTFHFIARNPVLEGELVWPVTQRYAGGEVVSWTGAADSETPAPRTDVSESAPPADGADVQGGGSGGSSGGTGTEPPATETVPPETDTGPAETETEATETEETSETGAGDEPVVTAAMEGEEEAMAAGDDGDDGMTSTIAIVIAIAALLLAVSALGLMLLRRPVDAARPDPGP
jgi:uncharacterized protein YcnI